MEFECKADKFEEIDEKDLNARGISFPEIHTELDQMIGYSLLVKENRGDCFATVPFCVTVEAESLGAKINLGDENLGPRAKECFIKDAKDMCDIGDIDFSTGRIATVLSAVEKLSRDGHVVALNVEGPLTIAMQLVDSRAFYKAIRKDGGVVERFVEVMSSNIFEYIRRGAEKGARIISFADPSGDVKIVGPKTYEKVCRPVVMNVLKRVESELRGIVVHICGKTSTALKSLGDFEVERKEYEIGKSYGEAVCESCRDDGVVFAGHRCIKTSPRMYENPAIFVMGLK